MEINYTRKHNDSFMSISGDVQVTPHESKMIESNDIPILLEFSIVEIDGVTQYTYNISRKENIQDYLETRDYSLEAIEKIVIGLQIGLSELERYLIDENHVLLEKETLFLERVNGSYQLSLCYYPNDNGTIQQQFRKLMEYVIFNLNGQDRKKAEHIYGVYDICLKEDYTLEQVLDYIQSNLEISDEIVVNQIEFEREEEYETDEEEYQIDSPTESLYDYYEKNKNSSFSDKISFSKITDRIKELFKKGQESKFKNTLKFEDFVIEPDTEIEEKTVLLKDSKPAGKLVYDGRDAAEDDFIITKDVFRIGSAKNNDAILNSKAVSGLHAKIYREDGNYYIEDLNSTNGSYVQNLGLSYKQRIKLKTMDVIRFADVSFLFM